MVRRFVFDSRLGTVVELGLVKSGTAPSAAYDDVLGQYRSSRTDSDGQALRTAALERAERREFAHKRYGTEHRWAE